MVQRGFGTPSQVFRFRIHGDGLAHVCDQHDVGETDNSKTHSVVKRATYLADDHLIYLQKGPDPSQNCTLPYLGLYSFFATQTIRVVAIPEGEFPTAPTPAFTMLKDLDWRTPGELPLEQKESTSQKVGNPTRRQLQACQAE